MYYLYLIHGVCIGLSKGIRHVTGLGSELEVAGMLTVLLFAQDLRCFLGLLHVDRPDRHPTCALDPFHVSLVHGLRGGANMMSCIQNIYKCSF